MSFGWFDGRAGRRCVMGLVGCLAGCSSPRFAERADDGGSHGACSSDAGAGCTCPQGYVAFAEADGPRCEDMDECSASPCASGRTCINTPGSHLCLCPAGQAEDASGACVDPVACTRGADYTLTSVAHDDDGFGHVLIDDGTCRYLDSVPLRSDAHLTLQALPARTSRFVGWQGCSAGPDSRCTYAASSKQLPRARFRLAHNVAFVTSSTEGGGLQGVKGADALCTKLAREAGLHGERFVAVLGESTELGFARLAGSRGWVRPDGRAVLDRVDEPYFRHPLTVDEQGGVLRGERTIWFAAGRDTCAGFTKSTPEVRAGAVDVRSVKRWAAGTPRPCAEQHGLACFGVGESTPLPDERVKGRLAFISDQGFSFAETREATIAEYDASCKSVACFRGLVPGTGGEACVADPSVRFKALLSTRDASAASRFSLTGPTWVREDGLPWLASASDLPLGKTLTGLAPYDPRADYGTIALVGFAHSPGETAESAADDCGDYTDNDGMGFVVDATYERLAPARSTCLALLICLEE